MKIFVTGGCGYKGHVLVPKLLERGFKLRYLTPFGSEISCVLTRTSLC